MPLSMSYLRVHCWSRWAFGPFSGQVHRLTSPKVRALHVLSTVRTSRKSAPFRARYLRYCGPIHLITGWPSLCPTSCTLCPISFPCGQATTCVGSIGLTQLSMKNTPGPVGVSAPVGSWMSSPPVRWDDPTHLPFGYGLSASLANSPSRGFKMTLHLRSTLPNFPSPPPHRGSQRPEHCPQSFAPQITRQHVWVGTPGHHRARSGSTSPSAILLHKPYGMSQKYACSSPGRTPLKEAASEQGCYR